MRSQREISRRNRRRHPAEVRWIALPGVRRLEPVVAGYVLPIHVDDPMVVEVDVAADQQFAFYLDGRLVGRGGETGEPEHWYYDTYRLVLGNGPHVLASKVWSWGGKSSAILQMEVFHGFYLRPHKTSALPMLATSLAPWKVKRLSGLSFTEHASEPNGWIGVPPSETLSAKEFPHDWLTGDGDGWGRPKVVPSARQTSTREKRRGHRLEPAHCPKPLDRVIRAGKVAFASSHFDTAAPLDKRDHLREEAPDWDRLLLGGQIELAPGASRRIVIDLQDYYCVHPSITASGGAGCRIRLTWAESLFDEAKGMRKGNRNKVFGKFMRGIWDELVLDGSQELRWMPLTWRAGRYLEMRVENPAEPVKLRLALNETRSPLRPGKPFQSDDSDIERILPICSRSFEMSSHDNYLDCPYYERLSYSGDGRIEALVGYAVHGEDLLARKAIALFASSCRFNGLCRSVWPSRVSQQIPSFALWWIAMVHDFAMWRRDKAFLHSVMPAVRSTLGYFLDRLNTQGLFPQPRGHWNFVDWVPEWNQHPRGGVPPGAGGVSALVNWILIYALNLAAALETHVGNRKLAALYRKTARNAANAVRCAFLKSAKSLYRDDATGKNTSEQTQVMAILSGLLAPEECKRLFDGMLLADDIARCSLFFTHYLFEACFRVGREDVFFDRLQKWNVFADEGYKTAPENFGDTRSDCHGWGSHPLYHLVANVAGIRPLGMGFRQVAITPHFCSLGDFSASCPHPNGLIKTSYKKIENHLVARVELPPRLSGRFYYNGSTYPLSSGSQTIKIPTPTC